MRILLAGGAGAIGRQLTPILTGAGYEVHATTRKPDRQATIAAFGATPVVLDVLDRDAVMRAVARIQPDAIIHQLTDLAGGVGAGNAHIRLHGTRNLVDAAKAKGIDQMITESIAWIIEPGDGPATEETPLDLAPGDAGIAACKTMEDATHELPRGIVLRYGYLYGPGTWYSRDRQNGIAARNGTLPATSAIANFIHVHDAARAAAAALDWPAGLVAIVDDEPAPGTAWVPVFAAALGGPPPPVVDGPVTGRPISNAKMHGLGFELMYPTWRAGFGTL